uniref:Methyltransferase-like protein 5 n=1 Tax=Parastrongyloides trichosuri TaxID=131310 RepID=A0A0N4Z984_PARTI
MKRKQFEWYLSSLSSFKNPKIELEQYCTSSELCTDIIMTIEDLIGFENKKVADLGCGPGILLLGAGAFEPSSCVGFDIDEDALKICRENIDEADLDVDIELIKCDLINEGIDKKYENAFDLILTNPPFGTKNNAGIDIKFIDIGIKMLKNGGSLFSLHKSSTRNYIIKYGNNIKGIKCEGIAQLKWNLDKTYKFHKQKTKDIDVDLIRFLKE